MHVGDLFFALSMLVLGTSAFDITRYDNVGTYWGQDAQGANNPNDTANYQKTLSFYCKDNSTNIIPIAFLNKPVSTGGLPEINVGNTCNSKQNGTFPGTSLTNCQRLASGIKACQKKGAIVTLSIGGALWNSSLTDSKAATLAETVWNLFLGGTSDTRPFGSAILDGIDLDIENGPSTGYAAFVDKIRCLASGASKKYYITAAPQCPFPDATLGSALNSTSFDAIFVQFYNNACGLQNFNQSSYWNFGLWDYWARNTSCNKDVKIYLGALGAPGNNDSVGYVPPTALSTIAVQMRQSYPSFGGVMLWDASQSYVNGKYAQSVKEALTLAGGVGFTYPACSAYGYVEGEVYNGGQQVSYDGYIWEAKWWTDTEPYHDNLGPWSEISACQGTPPVQPTASPSPSVVPGTPIAGNLGNSGTGIFEGAYFRNTGWMVRWFLGIVCLSAPLTVAGFLF